MVPAAEEISDSRGGMENRDNGQHEVPDAILIPIVGLLFAGAGSQSESLVLIPWFVTATL